MCTGMGKTIRWMRVLATSAGLTLFIGLAIGLTLFITHREAPEVVAPLPTLHSAPVLCGPDLCWIRPEALGRLDIYSGDITVDRNGVSIPLPPVILCDDGACRSVHRLPLRCTQQGCRVPMSAFLRDEEAIPRMHPPSRSVTPSGIPLEIPGGVRKRKTCEDVCPTACEYDKEIDEEVCPISFAK